MHDIGINGSLQAGRQHGAVDKRVHFCASLVECGFGPPQWAVLATTQVAAAVIGAVGSNMQQ